MLQKYIITVPAAVLIVLASVYPASAYPSKRGESVSGVIKFQVIEGNPSPDCWGALACCFGGRNKVCPEPESRLQSLAATPSEFTITADKSVNALITVDKVARTFGIEHEYGHGAGCNGVSIGSCCDSVCVLDKKLY
ncbi:hypothetical protein BGX26_001315 [Mortierella sp. AD094]|nr:hypothetical protein BGX26_001315 [Mortierella sp. AD094]